MVGFSGHRDTQIDDLYAKQRRTMAHQDRERDGSLLAHQAYSVPLLWWQRIIVNHIRPSLSRWRDFPSV
jgi:hypothetical protein